MNEVDKNKLLLHYNCSKKWAYANTSFTLTPISAGDSTT